MFQTLMIKIGMACAIVIAALAGGFAYGHHVGYASGSKKVAVCLASNAAAVADATAKAAVAQHAADAETLAQTQQALDEANAALASRTDAVSAANARAAALEASLRAAASASPKAAQWLGPLPEPILKAVGGQP
jgi:hypothetical protein